MKRNRKTTRASRATRAFRLGQKIAASGLQWGITLGVFAQLLLQRHIAHIDEAAAEDELAAALEDDGMDLDDEEDDELRARAIEDGDLQGGPEGLQGLPH